jgi:hypothetical protein
MRDLRRLVFALALLPAATAAVAPAAAQVGHAPGDSPYRDIRRGQTVTALVGQISGDGGRFGIGPHDGTTFGARYDFRTSHTLQLGVGLGYGRFDRLIIDPYVQRSRRTSGPVKQSVTFTEFDLQLNLTGEKTWHGFAPFVATGLGIAAASGTPADTSGFDFGRKIYFAPHAGFRFFLTRRIHLRAEARTAFWKVSYPQSFLQEPPLDPGTTADPHAVIIDGTRASGPPTPGSRSVSASGCDGLTSRWPPPSPAPSHSTPGTASTGPIGVTGRTTRHSAPSPIQRATATITGVPSPSPARSTPPWAW